MDGIPESSSVPSWREVAAGSSLQGQRAVVISSSELERSQTGMHCSIVVMHTHHAPLHLQGPAATSGYQELTVISPLLKTD